jgi:hypothetical protein
LSIQFTAALNFTSGGMTGYLRELKRELKQLKKRPGLGKSCSISDLQQVLPLAKFTLKAHAFCNLEARDDTSLDLLARLSGSFARSSVFPSGLVEGRNESAALDGCLLK